MCKVSFVPIQNTAVFPIILINVVPSEGFEIMIQSPVLMADCEENGVTRRFEAQDYVLEFIAVFDAG